MVSAITETVVTNFLGNTNLASTLNSPGVNNGTVTLTWSAIEGGSYQVEATTNLADSSAWTVLGTGVSPNQILGGYTNVTTLDKRFYRVGRTSVAAYDNAGTTLFATNSVAPGGSAYRGQTVTLTITLTGLRQICRPPARPSPASPSAASRTSAPPARPPAPSSPRSRFRPAPLAPTRKTSSSLSDTAGQSQAPTFTLTGGFTINP